MDALKLSAENVEKASTPDNTRYYHRPDGYTQRICRTCRREHEARYREAKHA